MNGDANGDPTATSLRTKGALATSLSRADVPRGTVAFHRGSVRTFWETVAFHRSKILYGFWTACAASSVGRKDIKCHS